MAIYFSSKNFKTAIIYSDADYENNGIYVYGNPEYLRALSSRVLKEKPQLGLLKKECIAGFNDKKGCCLFFEMNDSINGRSPIDFTDELKEAVKYFKTITNSEYEIAKFEYLLADQSGLVDMFFAERESTFMVKVSNWPHMEFRHKRRYLCAFLDMMSAASKIKIIGDGGVDIPDSKKTYSFIITYEGFGWQFKGTPRADLLDSLFEQYNQTIEKFTDEDANKYKISEQLINKINWLSSLEHFRWE